MLTRHLPGPIAPRPARDVMAGTEFHCPPVSRQGTPTECRHRSAVRERASCGDQRPGCRSHGSLAAGSGGSNVPVCAFRPRWSAGWRARRRAVPRPGDTRRLNRSRFGGHPAAEHLPVTFPQNLSQVAATPAQYPGVGGKVAYSEGIDVGCR